MVVVSRKTDFGSTTTPLSAMGFVVGLGIDGDSGEDALGSSIEAGRAEAPPIKTGGVLVLSFTMGAVVAPGTVDGSSE